MCVNNGWVSLILGLTLIGVGCHYLFHVFPKIARKQDATISTVALRVSSWLVVGGLAMMFLGILNLMGIIPSWT